MPLHQISGNKTPQAKSTKRTQSVDSTCFKSGSNSATKAQSAVNDHYRTTKRKSSKSEGESAKRTKSTTGRGFSGKGKQQSQNAIEINWDPPSSAIEHDTDRDGSVEYLPSSQYRRSLSSSLPEENDEESVNFIGCELFAWLSARCFSFRCSF